MVAGARSEDGSGTGVNPADDNSTPGSGAAYVFARSGSNWTEQAYLKSYDPDGNDNMGTSVALSGDGNTVAVGVYREDGSATGVGGDATDNGTQNSGAVVTFVYDGASGVWQQDAYLKAPNPGTSYEFGGSIALSQDGSKLLVGSSAEASGSTGINGSYAVGALRSGAAYLYTKDGATYMLDTYIKASNTNGDDRFGTAVAMNSDASTLAIGAPDEESNATGINGDQSDNSRNEVGAVYVCGD